MVVQRARVEIVDEHAPARSAGKAHPGTAEVGFPPVDRAERRAQRVADGTGCLAVAAEPVEIDLMDHDRAGSVQLLALQSAIDHPRSQERRVGNERDSTCRTRCSPDTKKNKKPKK